MASSIFIRFGLLTLLSDRSFAVPIAPPGDLDNRAAAFCSDLKISWHDKYTESCPICLDDDIPQVAFKKYCVPSGSTTEKDANLPIVGVDSFQHDVQAQSPTKTETHGGDPTITEPAIMRRDDIEVNLPPGFKGQSQLAEMHEVEQAVYKRQPLTELAAVPAITTTTESLVTPTDVPNGEPPVEPAGLEPMLPIEEPLNIFPRPRIPIPRPIPLLNAPVQERTVPTVAAEAYEHQADGSVEPESDYGDFDFGIPPNVIHDPRRPSNAYVERAVDPPENTETGSYSAHPVIPGSSDEIVPNEPGDAPADPPKPSKPTKTGDTPRSPKQTRSADTPARLRDLEIWNVLPGSGPIVARAMAKHLETRDWQTHHRADYVYMGNHHDGRPVVSEPLDTTLSRRMDEIIHFPAPGIYKGEDAETQSLDDALVRPILPRGDQNWESDGSQASRNNHEISYSNADMGMKAPDRIVLQPAKDIRRRDESRTIRQADEPPNTERDALVSDQKLERIFRPAMLGPGPVVLEDKFQPRSANSWTENEKFEEVHQTADGLWRRSEDHLPISRKRSPYMDDLSSGSDAENLHLQAASASTQKSTLDGVLKMHEPANGIYRRASTHWEPMEPVDGDPWNESPSTPSGDGETLPPSSVMYVQDSVTLQPAYEIYISQATDAPRPVDQDVSTDVLKGPAVVARSHHEDEVDWRDDRYDPPTLGDETLAHEPTHRIYRQRDTQEASRPILSPQFFEDRLWPIRSSGVVQRGEQYQSRSISGKIKDALERLKYIPVDKPTRSDTPTFSTQADSAKSKRSSVWTSMNDALENMSSDGSDAVMSNGGSNQGDSSMPGGPGMTMSDSAPNQESITSPDGSSLGVSKNVASNNINAIGRRGLVDLLQDHNPDIPPGSLSHMSAPSMWKLRRRWPATHPIFHIPSTAQKIEDGVWRRNDMSQVMPANGITDTRLHREARRDGSFSAPQPPKQIINEHKPGPTSTTDSSSPTHEDFQTFEGLPPVQIPSNFVRPRSSEVPAVVMAPASNVHKREGAKRQETEPKYNKRTNIGLSGSSCYQSMQPATTVHGVDGANQKRTSCGASWKRHQTRHENDDDETHDNSAAKLLSFDHMAPSHADEMGTVGSVVRRGTQVRDFTRQSYSLKRSNGAGETSEEGQGKQSDEKQRPGDHQSSALANAGLSTNYDASPSRRDIDNAQNQRRYSSDAEGLHLDGDDSATNSEASEWLVADEDDEPFSDDVILRLRSLSPRIVPTGAWMHGIAESVYDHPPLNKRSHEKRSKTKEKSSDGDNADGAESSLTTTNDHENVPNESNHQSTDTEWFKKHCFGESASLWWAACQPAFTAEVMNPAPSIYARSTDEDNYGSVMSHGRNGHNSKRSEGGVTEPDGDRGLPTHPPSSSYLPTPHAAGKSVHLSKDSETSKCKRGETTPDSSNDSATKNDEIASEQSSQLQFNTPPPDQTGGIALVQRPQNSVFLSDPDPANEKHEEKTSSYENSQNPSPTRPEFHTATGIAWLDGDGDNDASTFDDGSTKQKRHAPKHTSGVEPSTSPENPIEPQSDPGNMPLSSWATMLGTAKTVSYQLSGPENSASKDDAMREKRRSEKDSQDETNDLLAFRNDANPNDVFNSPPTDLKAEILGPAIEVFQHPDHAREEKRSTKKERSPDKTVFGIEDPTNDEQKDGKPKDTIIPPAITPPESTQPSDWQLGSTPDVQMPWNIVQGFDKRGRRQSIDERERNVDERLNSILHVLRPDPNTPFANEPWWIGEGLGDVKERGVRRRGTVEEKVR
ncbi:hypothetical protein EK21DRAFT_117725 [Setomelanomma holmii]|uniref:Uncharacterized protein n=1 Tax=Setomelanomma holmii TaxID=210430 RepID=A0A9P4LHD8_9PLEO|nr:hypothetical protein EK21DRAFT_117725 [Setomelanomma holmii]